jgi:hypothetical protein
MNFDDRMGTDGASQLPYSFVKIHQDAGDVSVPVGMIPTCGCQIIRTERDQSRSDMNNEMKGLS